MGMSLHVVHVAFTVSGPQILCRITIKTYGKLLMEGVVIPVRNTLLTLIGGLDEDTVQS